MINIKEHLLKLGFELPSAPEPVGNYKAVVIAGNFLYVSGQLPIINGVITFKGQIGIDLSVYDGIRAAQICALNILSQIEKYSSYDSLKQIVKIEGYINASNSFEKHAKVLNGASDLLAEVLGEKAGHIRTVVGCSSLPLGVPVEISLVGELA